MLTLHLPADIDERLEELSRKTGRSKSNHAVEAIIENLGDLEDLYLAEQRLRELRDQACEAIPLADLTKDFR